VGFEILITPLQQVWIDLVLGNCLLRTSFMSFIFLSCPNFFFVSIFIYLFLVENQGIYDPNLFEGDMILSPKERYNAEHGRDVFSSDRKRGALRFRLWPRGEVVYEIQPQLGKFSIETNSHNIMNSFDCANQLFNHKSCILLTCHSND